MPIPLCRPRPAVVGLENGGADPLQSAVAQTFNNPGKGSPSGSCTGHEPAGPEENQCAVHSGVMWTGSFFLLPGPRPAASTWLHGGAGLRRQVLEDPLGPQNSFPRDPDLLRSGRTRNPLSAGTHLLSSPLPLSCVLRGHVAPHQGTSTAHLWNL